MSDVGCVLLSMGTRPMELDRGLRSLLKQRDVSVDILVVGNGWVPTDLPEGVRSLALAENVGIPEGRNIGAQNVDGELIFFFDDDAELADDGFLLGAVEQFRADSKLGVLQPRVVDPDGLPTARRHVPRLRTGNPEESGDVAWFWEGCCLIRREAFTAAGEWPGHFWYGHEGIEVAWRIISAGYRLHYAAELEVLHTSQAPTRHAEYLFNNARNRVWVARRNLPHPFLEAYVLVWMTLTFLRLRSPGQLRESWAGFRAGWREPAGERRTIGWKAIWTMTLLGRPPIV